MSRKFEQLKVGWTSERTRHFLWVPACFAAGIALIYALPRIEDDSGNDEI
ncbi:MAG: hypothetical protein ACOYNL_09730 [Rickettsiales bacterium]